MIYFGTWRLKEIILEYVHFYVSLCDWYRICSFACLFLLVTQGENCTKYYECNCKYNLSKCRFEDVYGSLHVGVCVCVRMRVCVCVCVCVCVRVFEILFKSCTFLRHFWVVLYLDVCLWIFVHVKFAYKILCMLVCI